MSKVQLTQLANLIRDKDLLDAPSINKIEPEIRTGVQYALTPAMREKLKPQTKEE